MHRHPPTHLNVLTARSPAERIPASVVFILTLSALFAQTFAADPWTPGPGWAPVWADEFNGTSVDRSNWKFDLGRGPNNDGWGNNELETYTSSNAIVQNGELVISAIKNPDGTYTSARLKTQGLHSWTYGKIAARIRLPFGQGIWPAFWMLGDNIGTVGWPKCGEIDIMEMIGGGEDRDDSIFGTLHWDDKNRHATFGSGRVELPNPQFFYQDYHVFEVEWSSTEVIWKRDAAEIFRTSVDTSLWPAMDEFHRPFFIVLNVAVGGNWPGNPDASTIFPQTMKVDWVRVYSRDNAVVGNWAERTVVRNLPTAVSDAVDIGTLTFVGGTGSIEAAVNASGSGWSVARRYVIPIRYNLGNGSPPATWLKVLPTHDTGPYGVNDFDLDISVTNATAQLRLRTVGSSGAAATARIALKTIGLQTLVNSIATGAADVPAQTLLGSAVDEARGKAGIGAAPSGSAVLDVNGGDTRGLHLRPRSVLGAPVAGTWNKGTIILDSAADLFICIAPGTPGTWKKVGAP